VFLGELGLGGEVRPVSQAERRLAEAAKLGMTQAFLSDRAVPRRVPADMQVIGVRTLQDVLQRTVGAAADT
jgi:DNA repair protein RadA/Sms